MDVRRYKYHSPRYATIGEHHLSILPLPQSDIDRARRDARLRFLSRGIEPAPDVLDQEEAIQVLSRATDIDADDIRRLYPHEVDHLIDVWQMAQDDSIPELRRLSKTLKRSMITDPELMLDGAAAYQAQSVVEYYGKPSSEITVGQLAYYITIRNSYYEIHVNDERQVSKKWLMEND